MNLFGNYKEQWQRRSTCVEQLELKKPICWTTTLRNPGEEPLILYDDTSVSWSATFFNQYDEPAIVFDLTGRILMVNSEYVNRFKCSLAEVIGQHISHYTKLDSVDFYKVVQNVKEGNKVVFQQMIRKKKDGRTFPAKITVTPLLDKSYKVKGLVVVIRDLTEVMEYETLIQMQNNALEKEENLLLDLTKNINEMIALYDLENEKFVYTSPVIEKRLGAPIDAIIHDQYRFYKRYQIEDFPKLISFFKDKGQAPRSMEFEIIENESGSRGSYLLEITPIIEGNGEVKRHISILKDITELKSKNDRIKQLDQLGAIGQLAAGIAHEIKNPLTAVKGFVQLLAEESNSTYSDIILSELERIESIMGEFLMLAKPQRAVNLKKENINLILQDVVSFMSPEALLHNVKLHCDFKNVPSVHCESKQIKQVVINLVKNAMEAMPDGGNIYIRTFAGENDTVITEIIDEGKGISKEGLKRLREPFYTDKEKGSGLGLMVSYKIIEDHKGTLDFFSEEGHGTCVQITLPAKET